ncbi:hypothetical protein [Aquimarina sp. Aq78]|uniref:DUF7452 domain-containing protein n=1 Tax=Aquimarina sp. Aq78 TaxID=1191889 RepID=UPI00131C680D|nr:hypothetical protein [Aquimarina sp. Aq78]
MVLVPDMLFSQESYGSAFLHRTTYSNTKLTRPLRHTTSIDNPLTNNQPERALFVTQNVTSSKSTDNHPIGVRYRNDKWQIINLDRTRMPRGANFNVLALPRDHPNVYIHQNRNRGNIQIYTGSYDTRLRHPRLDNNPNAKFIVSQQVVRMVQGNGSRLISNKNSVGIYYGNGYWYIFNKNLERMPMNCVFNIYINEDIFTTAGVAIHGGRVKMIDNTYTNNKPEKLVFTTQRSKSPRSANQSNTAVSYQNFNIAGRPGTNTWQILNLNRDNIPPNEWFNVLTYESLSETPRYRVYMHDSNGTRREYLNTAMFMFDPSKNGNGTLVGLDKVEYDYANNLNISQVSSGAKDYGYLHNDGNSISKFIENKFGQNIGLLTLTDHKKLVIRLDYNLDGVIDHMEVYDGLNRRTSVFVLETAEAFKNYEEMINGRNIFCQMGRTRGASTGEPQIGIGASANRNTIYSGCGENGVFGGFSMPSIQPFGNSMSKPADVIDNFCTEVLKSTSNILGPELVSDWGVTAGIWGARAVMGLALIVTAAAAPAVAVATLTVAGGVALINAITDTGTESNSENSTNDPIPGEEPQADWESYCKRRTQIKNAYSLDNIQKMMRQQDCENPAENVSGVVMNTSGGSGGTPGPNGPWQPYVPNTVENVKYCQNKMEHNDFVSIWNRMVEEQCNNPTAQPGLDGRGCGTTTINTPVGKLQIGAADILAPKFARDVKVMLEKVVNPGWIRTGSGID